MIIQFLRNYILLFLAIAFTSNISADSHNATYLKISQKKELVIGMSKFNPPLNFGSYGVEFRMAEELSKFLDAELKVIFVELPQIFTFIQESKIDIAIAGISRNLPRAKKVWFSIPYLKTPQGVLVNKRLLPKERFGEVFEEKLVNTVQDLTKLPGLKLAVKKGSIYENTSLEIDKLVVNDYQKAFLMLQNGKVGGVLYDSLLLQYLWKQTPSWKSRFSLFIEPDHFEEFCIALPFGDIVLKNQVDTWIAEAIRNKLIDKWLKEFLKKPHEVILE